MNISVRNHAPGLTMLQRGLRNSWQVLIWLLLIAAPLVGQPELKQQPAAYYIATDAPRDVAFRGCIELQVDATDTVHKIFAVTEIVPVQRAGPATLLYPQWDTGSHTPTISVANLSGLIVTAGQQRLNWQRDPFDPHAFHFVIPAGARNLNLTFQYLSPPIARAGAMVMTANIVEVSWQNMLLYPAGWFARDIPCRPR
jgi:Peptidase M61 N-terminal domain